MAYYIMYRDKKDYKELEITKSKYFKRESRYVNNGSTIKEIDLFTTNFKDEEDLKIKLLKEGILNIDNCNSNLSIRSVKNNRYKKVMYGFLYQDSLKYIEDPSLIIKEINYKLMSGDFDFINKFVAHFINYYECRTTVSEINLYLNDSIRTGIINRHLYERDENGDTPLVRMCNLLIYKHFFTRNGNVVYKNDIDYFNLHTIIALYNYYPYYSNKKQDTDNVKVRKLKKDEFPGQLSFFD